jgi:hypothetical protein
MAGRPRWYETFFGRKFGEAVSERPCCPGDGCGLNIGVWSMRSLLDSETERGEGEGRTERKRAPCKTGRDSTLDVDAKGAESSDKRRQIRCPFHSDIRFSVLLLCSRRNSY